LQQHIITTVTAEDDLLEYLGGGAEFSVVAVVVFGWHDSSNFTCCDLIPYLWVTWNPILKDDKN